MRPTLLFLLCITSAIASADNPMSFRTAKKHLADIYSDHQESFYCGCSYKSVEKESGRGKKLAPDWESCGYTPRKQPKRASRIEWEHIVPAHHFGQHLECWREGGRKACKKDPLFRQIEGDMHNLVPAVGEVNGDRSNYKYGMIEGEARVYGACDAEVNFKAKRFEPAPHIRGDIARAYLYISDRYNIRLSKQQRALFNAWDKQDPPNEWETKKSKLIKEIQGNENKFVTENILECRSREAR